MDINQSELIRYELNQQTDRGAAIVGAAFLDTLLEITILARLRPLSRKIKDDLFGHDKPLSSFSGKINIGFALGLLTTSLHHDLMLVRQIRNKFAHRVEPLTFDDAEIRPMCERLKIPVESELRPSDPRSQFVVVVTLAAAIMNLQQAHGLLGGPIQLSQLHDPELDLPDLMDQLVAALTLPKKS
jgi:hypothetical protein